MNASCQKLLPLYTPEIYDQVIDLPVEKPPLIFISEKEYLELKSEVGYWQAMHKKAILRENKLKQTIKEQKGQIRDLRNRLFGKKSEKKSSSKDEVKSKSSNSKRPRGQQPGSKGHGRTARPHLSEKKELANFPENPKCSKCGKLYIPDESKKAEIIEVDVKAHTRKIIRCCMKKDCSCKGVPNTITAPMPPKVIPKSPYGISIWEAVLLNKFHYCQPTNRLLNQYTELGLPISPGTITGGLKNLKELFQPVYDAFYSHQMTEDRFHNDESSWKVFESIDGKVGNRWWLWVSRSASVVFFQIAPGRGADVPVEHFKNIQHQKIIVVCDRYSAYKSLEKQLDFIILAFCWAHVRRDFLDAGKKYPDLEDWVLSWVEKIGELYHINNLRCKEFVQKLPIQWQPASFKKQHEKLVERMDAIAQERDAFIEAHNPDNPDSDLLSNVKYKILTSLRNHWEGLSVFVDHPDVPMDNNKGEQSIRNPVTGRKNFYGSGSLWSSQLAAIMFSIFQTIALCGLNCNHWLRSYLTACAENHGKAPDDLSSFLPWEMDEERRHTFFRPPDT
ncbi:MAG: IS66 family transposase [Deltaproteobacteria bacterium]|jgi:transposase|nr:IS66 family transposase [Deltaproteobacteria bacterium]